MERSFFMVAALAAPFVVPIVVLCSLDFAHPAPLTTTFAVDGLDLPYFIGFASVLFLCFIPLATLRQGARNSLDDTLRLLYHSAFLYVAAGIRPKLETNAPLYVGCFVGFYVLYTAAFATANTRLHITLEKDNVSWAAVFAVAFCAPTLVLLFSNLMFRAHAVSPAFFVLYVVIFFVVLLILMGLMLQSTKYHLHHWFLSLACAHACVFTNDVCLVAQALFLASYVHGMGLFGQERMFK